MYRLKTEEEAKKAFEQATSQSHYQMLLFGFQNSRARILMEGLATRYGLDLEELTRRRRAKRVIHHTEVAQCPVCGEDFTRQPTATKVKTTCSFGCANTYFRTGISRKTNGYRGRCFSAHAKACVVCEESNIVEVHHYDNDKANNNDENLIPLCPTHHRYWHSRYRNLIEVQVVDYRRKFMLAHNIIGDLDMVPDTQSDMIKRRQSPSTRRTKRPPHAQLLAEIKELNYSGTGRKYGVSDNAVRKWVKWYERHEPTAIAGAGADI